MKFVRVQRSVLWLASAAIAALAGCGDDGGGGGATADADIREFDRRALLENLGNHVIVPTYEAFQADAAALDAAVAARCDALGGADETTALAAARDAWRDAMLTWQRAEVMQVGPLAMDDGALRDRIYSWDLVSSCAVDQGVAQRREDPDAYDISTAFTNRRGLDALEYLLFTPTLDHTCGAATVATQGWNELADADRAAARCGYALAAAADLKAQADALVAAWAPSGGNYIAELANTGNAQEMLNLVSDAMFYVELYDKDMKLGQPAGITDNSCGVVQEPCPSELELPHADFAKEAILANLQAFEALFTGGEGVGFDDWLIAFNAEALATEMTQDLADAIAAVEAIPGTLDAALTSDYDRVAAAHAAVKELTDDLKTQFLTVLGLDRPDAAAGDND